MLEFLLSAKLLPRWLLYAGDDCKSRTGKAHYESYNTDGEDSTRFRESNLRETGAMAERDAGGRGGDAGDGKGGGGDRSIIRGGRWFERWFGGDAGMVLGELRLQRGVRPAGVAAAVGDRAGGGDGVGDLPEYFAGAVGRPWSADGGLAGYGSAGAAGAVRADLRGDPLWPVAQGGDGHGGGPERTPRRPGGGEPGGGGVVRGFGLHSIDGGVRCGAGRGDGGHGVVGDGAGLRRRSVGAGTADHDGEAGQGRDR